jgi:hypothetical protein
MYSLRYILKYIGWLIDWLVGDHVLKSLFSVIITSNTSVEWFESRVRNEITVLQYKCSLIIIFPSLLTGNLLVLLYLWYVCREQLGIPRNYAVDFCHSFLIRQACALFILVALRWDLYPCNGFVNLNDLYITAIVYLSVLRRRTVM